MVTFSKTTYTCLKVYVLNNEISVKVSQSEESLISDHEIRLRVMTTVLACPLCMN